MTRQSRSLIERVLNEDLTDPQRGAALEPAREVLCLACAGSGKSRTLAYRIARLIAADGEDPGGIVAFTFTEKAADAIRRRVAGALGRAGVSPTVLGAMYIGTIHSYCRDVLGRMDARFRQFDVLDDNRLVLFLMSRYPELRLERLRDRGRNAYFECIREVANAWKNVNDELLDLHAVATADGDLGAVLQDVQRLLARGQFIDFSSMIRLVVDALGRGDGAADRAVAHFRHLMVDEYQDVNPAQEQLIRQLHRRSTTLFVVGDDDQAIYGWRGADVSNILTFQQRYVGCRIYPLSTNFRSTPAIVTAGDQFAAAELGAERIPKSPAASRGLEPRDFRRLWFTTRAQEAEWVADRIVALLGTRYEDADGRIRGLTPGDFAVMMRSTSQNEQDGRPRHAAFTDALAAREVPFSLEAGGGVFERPHASLLRDAFELLRNSSPTRPQVQRFFDNDVQAVFPGADFNALARVFADWGRTIHAPRGGPRRRVYPQQLVHDLLSAFGLPATPLSALEMRDLGLFSKMIEDVEAVYVSIDSADRFRAVLNFLQHVAGRGYDVATDDVIQRPDAVTVATVHKTKGLEYPVVFVVDTESQRFPRKVSRYRGWLPNAVIQDALARGAYQSTRPEEARLFYTAMTRSERYLYVTGAQQLPGGARRRQPSPFVRRLAHPELSDDPVPLPPGLEVEAPSPRVDEAVIPTSFSEIRYFLRCPKDYQYRKSFGFSPPIPDLFGFGMTVHASVGKLHEEFRDRAPTVEEAEEVARRLFHLKHVPPSGDPERPGPYERARDSAARMARDYSEVYAGDFERTRQLEVRFEIPVEGAVIAGAIDLLLNEDENGRILDASVIDFKAMEGGAAPAESEKLDWTELALQVQLYAKAARDVLGENARTGSVHLLKDNQRVEIPVSEQAVEAAVRNVEWAVDRIFEGDFPMRPAENKCGACDFRSLCPKRAERFQSGEIPPPLHLPSERSRTARAFSDLEDR